METLKSYYQVANEQMDITDLVTFIIVLSVAIGLRFVKEGYCLINIVMTLLVGFILPLSSAGREVDRNVTINGPAMDNFELLYTYLVFPNYWLLLFVTLLIINVRRSRKTNLTSHLDESESLSNN